MFLDFKVPIPSIKGKIFIKKVRDFHYVHYEFDSVYNSAKKYSLPKRTTIGKVCDDDSSMMFPNPNYLKFFPDKELPSLSSTPRSSCLKIGAWIVIEKIIHDYNLSGILSQIIGSKYGLFLDLIAYTIICENNAAQYYPDYGYNHPLFTEDMKIYSDSTISNFIHEITVDNSVAFLNTWNYVQDHREKIYISYDSTNKKSQAGDIDLVEVGHSKAGLSDTIFNYSIAYNRTNRTPLFYEAYSGSITDIIQLQEMIDKAESFGYKRAGFILDRGYFSEANIHYMDEKNYDFLIMVKGMKPFIKQIVLDNKGTFEETYSNVISEYGISGTTIKKKLFHTDIRERYIHLYFNEYKAAIEKSELVEKIEEMRKYIEKHQGENITLPKIYNHYFDLIYWNEGKENQVLQGAVSRNSVIEEEMKLCGYFAIVSSEKMNAKEAILLYKSRDDSEKLFRGDKSYLGNNAEKVYSSESNKAKIFIEFVALIVRSKMYVDLVEGMHEAGKRMNYMTVPAAIRELEKIEMIKYGNNIYHLDHAITKTQKTILKVFGIDAKEINERIESLSIQLGELDKVKSI